MTENYTETTIDENTDATEIEARKQRAEARRFYKLLNTIFYICNCAGFHVEGRITLRDKRTGKVWS